MCLNNIILSILMSLLMSWDSGRGLGQYKLLFLISYFKPLMLRELSCNQLRKRILMRSVEELYWELYY